jgi:hypothetical protein
MDIVDRPSMPAGYGIATDAEGRLPWSWVEQELTRARSYWVCSTTDDGRPHAIPVWALWLSGRLLFSTDPQSRKARNFATRPDIVVHLESGDDVVILEGRAQPMDRALVPSFCDAYDDKYGYRPAPDDAAHGLYQLVPDQVLAWREADFPTSATRFRRTVSS